MSDIGTRILHCDAHCAVVNKEAGEASEGAGKGMGCLQRLLADELRAPGYPPPPARGALASPAAAHRIDVPVTGCALFARDAGALRFLGAAFQSGDVEKRYWAIVEMPDGGAEPESAALKSAELVHWIQFDPKRNKSIAHDEPGAGRKKAILRCNPVGKGRDYMFLEIELVTGRHHQIRAQLARIGLRIKGDLKYGARRSEKGGGIRLHARSLSFPDPGGGGRISAIADPPAQDSLWLAFRSAAERAAGATNL